MTNHPLVYIVPVMLIFFALFWYFRNASGERLINTLRPKDDIKNADNWEIGPGVDFADGHHENFSKNMPLRPVTNGAGGFKILLPTPDAEPHYITINQGPLDGKTQIVMKGNISIEDGGKFFAKDGTSMATMCFYFQRQYDDWDATHMPLADQNSDANQWTVYYRWFATGNAMAPIATGQFTLTANFTDKWTSLAGDSEDSLNPNEGAKWFKLALQNGWRVGFVLGGGDGWGHGIIATKPAVIEITSIDII